MIERESIAKVLLIDNRQMALILALSQHRVRPELSYTPDLPGGIVDPGESELDAVVRETREEAGIELNPREIKLVYAQTAFFEAENKSVTKLLYIAKVEETPEVTLSWEHQSYEWIPLENAVTALSRPSFYKDAVAYVLSHDLV